MSVHELEYKLEKYQHKRQSASNDRIPYYDRKIHQYKNLVQSGGVLSDTIKNAVDGISKEVSNADEHQKKIITSADAIANEIKMVKDQVKNLQDQIKNLEGMNTKLQDAMTKVKDAENDVLAGGSKYTINSSNFMNELLN